MRRLTAELRRICVRSKPTFRSTFWSLRLPAAVAGLSHSKLRRGLRPWEDDSAIFIHPPQATLEGAAKHLKRGLAPVVEAVRLGATSIPRPREGSNRVELGIVPLVLRQDRLMHETHAHCFPGRRNSTKKWDARTLSSPSYITNLSAPFTSFPRI